ncbi:ABC transporter ATP-binding protein [Algoriphagus zhangzhouensis]|uniref:ABC-2 type transport system ATP-binding protein n=1 Tax=Algoriphagus zhangzhouensis TaxID=1073327 RepID=A0A1M7ZH69_9BACT|nr:ABC transporter ATP-binding protein [Algoriphagus zhangzhouensis]TDY44125.1 ABC-2 type transport system ATP-binding protein [Algoriphagus zhangzhouensis]SHO64260.1 ABC-2 type transport system ATP-binding protein [Algoriphagus zhangzhouensis]
MLLISNFSKKYPSGFEVLIDELKLEKGIHFIHGANGSGKSTLLKALAGIHPFQGKIDLNGIDLLKKPLEYRATIGYAEAEPQFPDFLSLDDLIQVVAKAKKANQEEINQLKSSFGADSFSGYPVGTFSSGMLKKSALILAFLGNPQLVILDEPFTTIDTQTQNQLTEMIKGLAAQGVTFLITSHQNSPIANLPIQGTFKMESGRLSKNG